MATRRRRLDTDPAVDQADQRAGKGSLQPWLPRCGIFRNHAVQCRQQGFNLAEFGRPLMAEPLDRAQQQPKADLLRHADKSVKVEYRRIESFGVSPRLGGLAPGPRKVAFGAIDQY